MKVAIFGASNNSERFAHKAMKLLKRNGHEVVGVTPRTNDIEGMPCYRDIDALIEAKITDIHTLTMYVNDALSTRFHDAILKLKPQRIIFNPGSENSKLAKDCAAAGIEVAEDCTLVMLNAGRF